MKIYIKRFLYRLLYLNNDVKTAIYTDNYNRLLASKPPHIRDIFEKAYTRKMAQLTKTY